MRTAGKSVKLRDFLTSEQIDRCKELYPNREEIRDQVVIPNMGDISSRLGHVNPEYISYAIYFIIQNLDRHQEELLFNVVEQPERY